MAKFFARLLAVVAIVATLWSMLWGIVAYRARTGLEAWIEAETAAGSTIAHDEIRLAGFPTKLTVACGNFSFTAPDGSWVKLGRIDGYVSLWTPHRADLAIGQGARFQLARRIVGKVVVGTTGAMQLQVDPSDVARPFREFQAADVRLVVDQGGAEAGVTIHPFPVSFDSVTAARLDPKDGPWADGFRLDAHSTTPSQKDELRPDLQLRVTSAMKLPSRLDPAQLSEWRDGGGGVQLEQARVAFGEVSAEISGPLRLDSELRPTGTLATRWTGLLPLIQRLRREGKLEQSMATTLGLLVNLSSKNGVAQIPLVLENGQARLAGVSLGVVPPLAK